jgi:choline dehydrogenase-like flavoprotein
MLLPNEMVQTDPASIEGLYFDVVIVGSGISGAIVAKQLSQAGKRVLVLEAGVGEHYNSYLQRFYATASKDNQSPYAINLNAPMPRADPRKILPGHPDSSAYIVQTGPFATDTTYTRILNGTTMHWEAKVIRMLPKDFVMRRDYGQGLDWPIDYDDIEPFYCDAEREIGVSANREDAEYLDTWFQKDYVFPMQGLPLSYLDMKVNEGIEGTSVGLYGQDYDLKVRPFPQGRNGIPNPLYDNRRGFTPVGAVSDQQTESGGRCQGNNACVPLCPVQAKYHAGKTLAATAQTGNIRVLKQAVASRVIIDPASGRVRGIEYKSYRSPDLPEYETHVAKAPLYVLAANAIENPRLMLASGLQSRSGLMGRNLMDHAYLLSWALMPQICGVMRGTNCTGGIVDLRGGTFRAHQAAFSADIHNDGWGWAVGSPYSDLIEMVDSQNKFGCDLRQALIDRVSRQLQFAFMIEVLPNESNRVNVDPAYTDRLGNMRPVISFNVPDYTLRGAAYARQFAKIVFQRLGAADYTAYDPADYGFVTYENDGYVIRGGNHIAGTHVMGSSKSDSVVDQFQRSWDHDNLYLAGGGSMPTIGTANVTLTIAALCFRTATAILKQLG